MRDSYKSILWESAVRTGTAFSSVGSLILAFVMWKLLPDTALPVWAVVPVGTLMAGVTWTFIDCSVRAFRKSRKHLPRVSCSRQIGAQLTFLLDASEFYSHGALVSFFLRSDDDFERQIGIGFVRHIQEDGRIQVVFLKAMDGYNAELKQLAENNAKALSQLIVKPTISQIGPVAQFLEAEDEQFEGRAIEGPGDDVER